MRCCGHAHGLCKQVPFSNFGWRMGQRARELRREIARANETTIYADDQPGPRPYADSDTGANVGFAGRVVSFRRAKSCSYKLLSEFQRLGKRYCGQRGPLQRDRNEEVH